MNSRVHEFKALVTEFHKNFNLPICTSYSYIDTRNFPLRINLISEEYGEYLAAADRISVLDGLGDTAYVVFGTVITTGINPLEYNYIKPTETSEYKLLFNEEIAGLLLELKKPIPCHNGLLDKQTQVYWRLEAAAAILGVDLLEITTLIHKSNMTKLWSKTEVDELRFQRIYKITPKEKGYVVSRLNDNKIMKPPGYMPVDLSGL